MLSKEKYSYSIILKRCEKHGFYISMHKISDIIKMKGKKCQVYFWLEKNQRTTSESLNIAKGTVNKSIKSDLKLIKTKKHDVHRLMTKHISHHKAMCVV